MIKGLRGASIWSEDVKNLLPFYRYVLGLKVGLESPGFVVLGELGAPALAAPSGRLLTLIGTKRSRPR